MLTPCWSVPQNYVPFNVRQSGTFTPYLTGKVFNSVWSLKNDSGLRGLCGETIVSEDGMLHRTSPCLLSSTVWVTASGFLTGRLLKKKKKILLKCVENMWSLYPVSFQRTKDVGIWIVPPGVFGNGVLHDVYRGSVNLHNVNFSGIKKNNLFLASRHVIQRD